MKSLQALFGGTFDPVHYGHLKPVETLANLIGLTRVTIIPNNVPPHRPQPEANSAQRKHMLELAIADKPLFTLDERELKRNAPSYTAQNTERVAAGARTGRAAGVYYWSGFIADLSDLVRIRNDTRQCTFDRLSASWLPT
ncbi:nicotinic acid mononucleotide adenylyltransferase [Escherichia coli]|uniref:Nicotinate-nucleotide adenylyltransferase n=1 Tax=Escherichia coli TaxID=562 RepID=A0A377KC61_ECOLX|nr:nicotinic acid mononucleotide adenylyltransferase [Escherichia coli]